MKLWYVERDEITVGRAAHKLAVLNGGAAIGGRNLLAFGLPDIGPAFAAGLGVDGDCGAPEGEIHDPAIDERAGLYRGRLLGAVEAGDLNNDFLALAAATGDVLYRFNTGGSIGGGVISYALHSKQYVATTSGTVSAFFGGSGLPAVVIFAVDSGVKQVALKPLDPDQAPIAAVDRFSDKAAHLQLRTPDNHLPGPNEPVDFDTGPFITQGLAPATGKPVRYYNFDVQSTAPAPVYVLYRQGEDKPVADQLDIIDTLPGDKGYNDFRQIWKVTVPKDYVANTITDRRPCSMPAIRWNIPVRA